MLLPDVIVKFKPGKERPLGLKFVAVDFQRVETTFDRVVIKPPSQGKAKQLDLALISIRLFARSHFLPEQGEAGGAIILFFIDHSQGFGDNIGRNTFLLKHAGNFQLAPFVKTKFVPGIKPGVPAVVDELLPEQVIHYLLDIRFGKLPFHQFLPDVMATILFFAAQGSYCA